MLIFVYYNKEKKKIKVLSHEEAMGKNDILITEGWKHNATLDPRKWLEYLFNEAEPEDIIAEIRELSTSIKRGR